jgi:hypothetical protein
LSLDHKTVRRHVRAATADELLTEVVPRTCDLDKCVAHLAECWEQGCTSAAWLTVEPRECGYRGSERTVRRQLQAWRDGRVKPAAVKAVAPEPR